MTDLPQLHPSREQTIQILCLHFAQDHLSTDELEDRLDRAHRAVSRAELQTLLADLPALSPIHPMGARALSTADPGEVAERQAVIAIMGGAPRKGVWTPPRQLHVVAVMGGAELDFREARFGPGATEVTVFALMGGAEIVVPPEVRVELNGAAIMGGFELHGQASPAIDPRGPILRIGGLAIMGGVSVYVRLPGESARDAKRRIRAERKAQRRLRGR